MQFGIERFQEMIRPSRQSLWLPELCRKRIRGYADSIMELSKELNIPDAGIGFDRQSVLEGRILAENRDLLCDSLNTIAELMENVAEEISSYIPLETRKRKLVTNALREEGIKVKDAYYLPKEKGKTGIGLDMYCYSTERIPLQRISDLLSVILRKNLQPSISGSEYIDREEKVYVFVEEAPFLVMTGFSKVTKNNESISGDNYSVLDSEDGKTDILISDGTGSGEEAFNNSRKVIELLEKMLEAGYDRRKAVKMLNMAFCAIEQEKNHPTLDLCSVDLYDGSCQIMKFGAAATFLKRGMDVEILSGVSLPLGMTRNISVNEIHSQLRDGDFLIMMTDGVLDALDEQEYEVTMQKIISTVTEQNPEGIAERILQTVLCLDGGRILDDMMVLTAGFWKDTRKERHIN